jgi:1,4-dihydroxy-2-naphthoate octaprenyltransferase
MLASVTDELQRLIVALLSTIPFVAIFVALTYRVGEFRLLPGEPGMILAGFVIGYAIVVGFFVLLEILPPPLEFVVVLAATVATLGSLPIVLRWQNRYLRGLPSDQRAELEKRGVFLRTDRGRAVFVAFGIGLVLWAVIFSFMVG